MVLTVSFALSGDRACLPPSPAENGFRKLDASVGASGPHDFAVHLKRRSSCSAISVHRIPPHVRDDRETPLLRDGMIRSIAVFYQAVKRDF
jgi:hypothetical protein